MVNVHTKVNVADAELFTKSHVNNVVISMLEIIKIHKKIGTTLSRLGPKGYAQ